MPSKKTGNKPSWGKVKSSLEGFDRASLTQLIHDLYELSKENQLFLHSRFELGEDVLEPYKRLLNRWLRPNVLKNQDVSVSKALKAISDYRKAVGQPEGVAELLVSYCEEAAGFSLDVGMNGDSWFSSLLRCYEDALKTTATLDAERRKPLFDRLDHVRGMCGGLGWGVGDQVKYLWAEHERASKQ